MSKNLKHIFISLTVTCFVLIFSSFSLGQNVLPSESYQTVGSIKLAEETLFVLQRPFGGLSIRERSDRVNHRLLDFAENRTLSLDALEIYRGDNDGIPVTVISAENILLMMVTDQDAKAINTNRDQLAKFYLDKIKNAVSKYRQERSFQYFLNISILNGIFTFFLIIVLLISNRIFNKIYKRLKYWGESYIRPVRFGNWELIKANQLDDVIIWIVHFTQTILVISLLAIYFPFILERYPWTRAFAKQIEGYLFGTLQKFGTLILDYLPNLLIIIFVITATTVVLKLSKPFFQELHESSIVLPNFYAEWAKPTYRLITFLTIALAAAIIFPLLPGFQSPAFQGISVFLGFLISLGSTSVIANLISGTILIYTRAFRVGDYIKIGDISGKVLETTLLVTRILTPLNIVVSIPNSQISTSFIENFSFGYRELNQPSIVQIPIYLGYEISWRDAYQAFIKAALKTEGVLKSPSPFVLQRELKEVYVIYFLNVYIDFDFFKDKNLEEFEQVHSQLHENIRDCCAEAGIKIFAPSYEADPNKYGPASNSSSFY